MMRAELLRGMDIGILFIKHLQFEESSSRNGSDVKNKACVIMENV
jgi:hypothetical protein